MRLEVSDMKGVEVVAGGGPPGWKVRREPEEEGTAEGLSKEEDEAFFRGGSKGLVGSPFGASL